MHDHLDFPDGRLRVGARERDNAANILREAVVDGRIEVEELNSRLPSALNAFTREDLYRVLLDLVPEVDLPSVVAAEEVHGDGPGMRWETPLLIRSGWQGHEELGDWNLPPFVEVIGTGWGTVTLNCVAARPLAKVIDVVITGNPTVHIVVPEGWGVDVQQLNMSGQSGVIESRVPSRPEGDFPRLILRGSSTMPVRIRTPTKRDLRKVAKHRQRQELTAG